MFLVGLNYTEFQARQLQNLSHGLSRSLLLASASRRIAYTIINSRFLGNLIPIDPFFLIFVLPINHFPQ